MPEWQWWAAGNLNGRAMLTYTGASSSSAPNGVYDLFYTIGSG